MTDASFWAFQAKDYVNVIILAVTCFAVYYGPIRAVQISRKEEVEALKLKRKSDIFAALMKTRRFQLDPEHVSSLNLIQVYFHDEPSVITAYKSYIGLLYRKIIDGIAAESQLRERDNAFIELVFEISKSLGFSQDKKEIEDLAYSPEGWANDQATIRKLHFLMIELFENRRSLSVTPAVQPNAVNMFPPPPEH